MPTGFKNNLIHQVFCLAKLSSSIPNGRGLVISPLKSRYLNWRSLISTFLPSMKDLNGHEPINLENESYLNENNINATELKY